MNANLSLSEQKCLVYSQMQGLHQESYKQHCKNSLCGHYWNTYANETWQ